MIELIRTVVETLAQILPKLGTMRTDKRLRELGVALRRHLQDGDYPYAQSGGQWIAGKITTQVVNLERLGGLLASRSSVLQLADAESYNKLVPLLESKFGALVTLLGILRRGALPLDPTQADLDAFISVAHPSGFQVQHDLAELNFEVSGRWRSTALNTGTTWGPEILTQVETYLTRRAPSQQIEEIKVALVAMREALEEHFSIDDVLLEVGDRSLADEQLYY